MQRPGRPDRLEQLWDYLRRGRLQETRRRVQAWRDEGDAPAELELLLAGVALAEGDAASAATSYAATAAAGGGLAVPARMGLGNALVVLGDVAGAIEVLRTLVQQEPTYFLAHLRLGELFEQRGDHRAALPAYYAAVVHAQRQGRWLGEGSTAPAMRPRVVHAMHAIDSGRQLLFQELLAPLRLRHGRDALVRVERGLAMYLGALPALYDDARQQPTFFYVPDIPATPFPSRSLFPWLEELEAATDAIRAEMLATRARADAYAPFLGVDAEALRPGLLAGSRGTPAWDAYFFYRHGVRDAAHAGECAVTAAAIERTPLVRIRDHAPEICFSVLAPGSHILPHRGVTNTRLTVHLPLLVPGDCALQAGGELHAWREGRAMVFDDTFEHEAWNRSAETRVILLMDTWNPHLAAEERAAVTSLVEAIGDFNASVPAA